MEIVECFDTLFMSLHLHAPTFIVQTMEPLFILIRIHIK